MATCCNIPMKPPRGAAAASPGVGVSSAIVPAILFAAPFARNHTPIKSDAKRTGATFVHDWFALGIWLSIAGHVFLALRDPVALDGMRRGFVTSRWARTKRPRWYEEETGQHITWFTTPGGATTDDGCHPNAAGYARIEKMLGPAIRAAITQ